MTKPSMMKCGDCLFFKSNTKPGHKVCCSKEGIKAFAQAKICFFPDVTKISNNIEHFALLSSTFSAFTAKQRKILLALLAQSAKAKNKEYPFGTKVYLTSDGKGEYLSDWLSGYVLGYQNDYVIVCGSCDRKTIGRSYVAYLYPDSIIPLSIWAKKRAELKANGKINNPRKVKQRRITSIEGYEPPTIDSAPTAFKSKQKKVKTDVYEKISNVLSY